MFNENITRITGHSAEELSRRKPVDLFPGDEKKKF
jgi:hypothetical protein